MPRTSQNEHGLDLPPTDIEVCVKITIATTEARATAVERSGEDPTAQGPSNREDEVTLKFYRGYFKKADIHKTLPRFVDRMAAVSSGLIMMYLLLYPMPHLLEADMSRIVENWHTWAKGGFLAAVPGIPMRLLGELENGLSIAMLPTFDERNLGKYWQSFCLPTQFC